MLWNALSAPGCGNQGLEGVLRLGRFGAGYRRYPMPDSGRLFFGLGKMPYNKSRRVTGRRQPDMNLPMGAAAIDGANGILLVASDFLDLAAQ